MSLRTSTPGCLRRCRLPARIVLCAVLFAAEAASAGDADPAASVQPYSSRRTAAAMHRDSRPAQPSGLSASPPHADRATLAALRAALSEPDSRRRPPRVPAVLPVEPFTSQRGLVPLPGNNIAIQADELGHANRFAPATQPKGAMGSQSDGLGHADRFAPGTQGGDVVLTAGWLRAEPAALDQRDTANPLRSTTLPEADAPRRLPRANPLRARASASSRLN
ncbi:MAG: hypothetical protein WD847_06735 [Pirellulales bacterium]